jgi:hypothetical protein
MVQKSTASRERLVWEHLLASLLPAPGSILFLSIPAAEQPREIIQYEEIDLSCAICEERKEKRFCPAVHGRICPQCCGVQREVTLDCPSDCPYLQQARAHAKERNELPEQVDSAALFPQVEIDERFLYEREELILGLSFALAKSARGGRSRLDGSRADRALADHSPEDHSLIDRSLIDHSPVDRDLIAALSSLAETYETLVNSNLIYEPPTANLAHQNIVRDIAHDIEAMVREFRETERQHIDGLQGHEPLRDSDVLKALVFLLRMGWARTSGRPKSRAFLDSLLAMFPEKQSVINGPEETGSRIVIP